MPDMPNANEIPSQTINNTLIRVDEYVRREYLSVLSSAIPVPRSDTLEEGSNIRLVRLDTFTFEDADMMAQKIRGAYGVLERSGASALLLLDGREERANLYLGVFTRNPEDCTSSYRAFMSSFTGVFPGSEYTSIKQHQACEILKDILSPDINLSVAAVSAFPAKRENDKNLSGLEALIDGMRGRPFTMILLASAMNRASLVNMRQGYEKLCTQISPFKDQNISLSSSTADTVALNYSSSLSESLSVTTGVSRSHTESHGTGKSVQSEHDNALRKRQATSQMISTAGVSLLALASGGSAASLLGSLFLSSAASNVLNSAVNLATGAYDKAPETETEHDDVSDTEANHEDTSKGKTTGINKGLSITQGKTSGQTVGYNIENKSVSDLLERLSTEIKELSALENEGAFSTAAYFMAADNETALSAASLYRSLVTSDGGAKYYSPVYCWDNPESTKMILSSLAHGEHPAFSFKNADDTPLISAAQPIGLPDIPRYFCLPGKSVPGLTVTKHASFARDIIKRDKDNATSQRLAQIGSIYHMGAVIPDSHVEIDINTLASHLFVSGATGTGKSNFCCCLTDQLRERGVKVLVIEPAKGEYPKVFGARGFKVYGTNPQFALPLRINPFAFPKGITSAEHIERLLSIFCAAWPMYSAMPAIMKEALEAIYRKNGFDEIWGSRPDGGAFPNFDDLLEVLPEIIKNSEYSQEVQGNYTGALVTRVKSLTNGIYSVIFTDDELSDSELFDDDVIIDLSRVGSEETKSLIMGFAITRLAEYRSVSGLMNSPLKHITLLEEAHHILGRQAQASSPDTGNMRAASVEMISNAIREMRTYGEGFIIADQSSSVMDPSVLSNTQTKVFFMMPRHEDISAACDAASLTDEQGRELARLPRGTAMVWQNNWTDAVLCRINYFDTDRISPYTYELKDTPETDRELAALAARVLIRNKCRVHSFVHEEMPDATFWDTRAFTLGRKRETVKHVLSGYRNKGEDYAEPLAAKGTLLEMVLDADALFRQNKKATNISEWATKIEQGIHANSGLDVEEVRAALSIILLSRTETHKDYRKLYIAYLVHSRKDSEELYEAASGYINQ